MEVHKKGTDDGWHGVIAEGGQFTPEIGRYHLYIGLFCPFAHRANLVRYLYNLTDAISLSVVMPYPKPWVFPKSNGDYPNATVDHLYGSQGLKEIYDRADPDYQGRYSVPVLWDKKTETIVNNESAEILRWLPTSFSSIVLPPPSLELYPSALQPAIDVLTPFMQSNINGGVYKVGFSPDQTAYDVAITTLFGALNYLEELIHRNGGPYVLGKQLTELDVRLYATIVRFDTIYVQHFKCNLGTIRHDYPVLNEWLKGLYWGVKGFAESTDFKHIKENYSKSMVHINPTRITPMGPFPEVEVGVETDWSKLKPGGVKMEAVLVHQQTFSEALKQEGITI